MIASCTCPDWGLNPQCSYVPWLRIEPATFWCTECHSSQSGHPARAVLNFLNCWIVFHCMDIYHTLFTYLWIFGLFTLLATRMLRCYESLGRIFMWTYIFSYLGYLSVIARAYPSFLFDILRNRQTIPYRLCSPYFTKMDLVKDTSDFHVARSSDQLSVFLVHLLNLSISENIVSWVITSFEKNT